MIPDPKDTNRKNTDTPDIREKNTEETGANSTFQEEREVSKNTDDINRKETDDYQKFD